MTSIQRDPRKQYVLNKRQCKDLSITQKLYHPECMKEANKEISINPKPFPKPRKIPSLGPTPPIPYSFQPAGSFEYSPSRGVNKELATAGAVVAGAGIAGGSYLIRRGLRATPREDGYRRVPTSEQEIEMRDLRRVTNMEEGIEEEAGTEMRELGGRSSEVARPSESGLRRRLPRTTEEPIEPMEETPLMEDVPLEDPVELVQSRIPNLNSLRRLLRMPEAPTEQASITTQASEIELQEANASRTAIEQELDDLITQSVAETGGITEAEQAVETLQGEGTAGADVAGLETELTTFRSTAEIEAMEEGTFETEGLVDTGAGVFFGGAGSAEAGAEAVAEAGTGALEATGVEAGAEGGFAGLEGGVLTATGGEEVAGGGPEDIPMDVIAGATLIFGTIGVGIASLFGAGKPKKYKGISGTAVMSGKDVDKALKSVQDKLKTETRGTPTYNSLMALNNALSTAKTNKTDVVSFKDAGGKPDISVPLSSAQLATAIKVYQKNPNAYKGMDKTKLEVMGLSPVMAQGEDGAIKTSSGTYIPKTSPDGKPFTNVGNITNFYTANNRKNTFTNVDNIDSLAVPDSAQKKQIDDSYIARATSIINAETDPAVKKYLNYELNLFKYNNGYTPNKPTPVPRPTLSTEQQAKMTQLTDELTNRRRHLTAIQNSINNKQSILDGIKTNINNIKAQDQERAKTVYREQLENYHTQANAYNQRLAQNLQMSEQRTASANIMYARATNTPLNAPIGKYLTQSQIQTFNHQLQSGQIKTTGVVPLTSVTPPTIKTRANGSPIVNPNALQTVPAKS